MVWAGLQPTTSVFQVRRSITTRTRCLHRYFFKTWLFFPHFRLFLMHMGHFPFVANGTAFSRIPGRRTTSQRIQKFSDIFHWQFQWKTSKVKIKQKNLNLLLCFWSASQMLLFLFEELLSISETEMYISWVIGQERSRWRDRVDKPERVRSPYFVNHNTWFGLSCSCLVAAVAIWKERGKHRKSSHKIITKNEL